MNFFNTVKLRRIELRNAELKAKNQEEKIAEFFKLRPKREFTPFQVQQSLGLKSTPITSVRRAMTNLTAKHILVKTSNRVKGDYGQLNYTWKYKSITSETFFDLNQFNIFDR